MRAEFTKNFAKQLGKYPSKIQNRFSERLEIFLQEPSNPFLNSHHLKGKWIGCKSINITGDIRAIYKEISEDLALFVEIGTHSQLYK